MYPAKLKQYKILYKYNKLSSTKIFKIISYKSNFKTTIPIRHQGNGHKKCVFLYCYLCEDQS